jgi:type I restriction enzyme S subunit
MSAVSTNKKRERQSASQAPARHFGEGRNPATSSFRTPRSGGPESNSAGSNVSKNAYLGDLLTIIRGVTYKKGDASSEPSVDGVPILRATNIQGGALTFDGLVYVPRRYVSDDQLLHVGDIVVAASSGSRSVVGKAAPLKTDWFGSFGAFCFGLRPKSGIDPDYLAWFLQTSEYRRQVSELAAGVNINNLRAKHIEQIPIPVPSLEKQGAIVAEIEKQFTRLDAGVAALRRVQANLKRYRAAVLKAACEGRLVSTEAELAKAEGRTYETGEQLLTRVGGVPTTRAEKRRAGRLWGAGHVPDLTKEEQEALPDGWAWTKVQEIGFDRESAVQVGPMSMKSSDFTDEGLPVLNVGCVQWDRFAESKLDHLPITKASGFDRYRIKAGDVLFTRSGTVGRCAVAQPHQEGWLMTFHLLRARPNPQKCLPAFLRAVFEGAPHIRRQTKAASVGSTRAGFNTNLLANLAVPLPPLAEQTRIVAEVERRLSVIEEMEVAVAANLQRATRLRQSILRKTFASTDQERV